jgi:hypothetical protein
MLKCDELLLVGEGASADAAYGQAISEGLKVTRLAPDDVSWNEACLTDAEAISYWRRAR